MILYSQIKPTNQFSQITSLKNFPANPQTCDIKNMFEATMLLNIQYIGKSQKPKMLVS